MLWYREENVPILTGSHANQECSLPQHQRITRTVSIKQYGIYQKFKKKKNVPTRTDFSVTQARLSLNPIKKENQRVEEKRTYQSIVIRIRKQVKIQANFYCSPIYMRQDKLSAKLFRRHVNKIFSQQLPGGTSSGFLKYLHAHTKFQLEYILLEPFYYRNSFPSELAREFFMHIGINKL